MNPARIIRLLENECKELGIGLARNPTVNIDKDYFTLYFKDQEDLNLFRLLNQLRTGTPIKLSIWQTNSRIIDANNYG